MESKLDLAALGAVGLSEAGEAFRSFLRGCVREMLCEVMAQEVAELCGPRYRPSEEAEHVRAGSAPGTVLVDGRGVKVKRPRVRRRKAESGSEEVQLATYRSAQEPGELREHILAALLTGVSSREQRRLHGSKTRGTSRSEVSRLWQREGRRILEEFRSRDILSEDWLVLMVDGIGLGGDLLAVVALGITRQGKKVLLDFEIGSSESYGVCDGLMKRLISRGFGPMAEHVLFSVTDGADALRKAILKRFPGTEVQRCLVHKERNLSGYLSRKKWGELAKRMKRLRQVQGADAAREALGELRDFVGDTNEASLASLDEAGDDLIRVLSPIRTLTGARSPDTFAEKLSPVSGKSDRLWGPIS